jgi:hypothetical protein
MKESATSSTSLSRSLYLPALPPTQLTRQIDFDPSSSAIILIGGFVRGKVDLSRHDILRFGS